MKVEQLTKGIKAMVAQSVEEKEQRRHDKDD